MSDWATSPPQGRNPLLPGSLRDGDGRRSPRDWAVDVILFVLAIALGSAILGSTWQDHGPIMAVVDIVLGTIACLALWVRRQHPFAIALFAVLVSIPSAFAGGAGVVALFNAAIRTSRRELAGLVALGMINVAVAPLLYPGHDPYLTQVIVGTLITGVVVGWGLFTRARRELVRSLRERAERLEAEQRLHAEQAREAERRRIAREMHDVLAHRVSLLSLHAGALEFRPDAPADEIAEAAGVIRATAHAALQDLRDVIGVLREGTEGTEPPQPTLAQVPELVEESRAAGMRVGCRIDAPDALPEALGRTVYRIVQEGLTNARKHAPAAAVEVTIGAGEREQLVVEVVSRRPVGVAAGGALASTGAGTGLIGLAERVGLAGGRLEHGPDGDGDFVLRATLPWEP
jgi:signal transduction histidine kinase